MVLLVIVAVLVVVLTLVRRQAAGDNRATLDDAKAEARRWTERLGGQVYNLSPGDNPAAAQALADAAERYNAAGSQLDQARTAAQCRMATETALEGLYYVRAARKALGMDPGPELPDLSGRAAAGAVTESRQVNVGGQQYAASPSPSAATPNYYPGGMVAGRPVPQGWYSTPWWKTALVAGAWGAGSALLFDSLFSGMNSVPAWDAGYATGYDNGMFDGGWGGGDWGGGDVGGGDWGDSGGDWGGGDFGGGDW